MAVVKPFADFLFASNEAGTTFKKTITLGRLTNYLHLDDRLSGSSSPIVQSEVADDFFRKILDVQHLDSLDFSDYEGATIVHDLNNPIPEELTEAYDTVIDAGTLEHVFDYPTALRNTLSLIRVGGSVFIFTPANNLFGHGFYQFSSDLFYRVLAPHNGCRIQKMAIMESYYSSVERGMKEPPRSVLDPSQFGIRADMRSCFPSSLFIHATKIAPTPARLTALQSDYVEKWKQPNKGTTVTMRHTAIHRIRRGISCLCSWLPSKAKHFIESRIEWYRYCSLHRNPCFEHVPRSYFSSAWTERLDELD